MGNCRECGKELGGALLDGGYYAVVPEVVCEDCYVSEGYYLCDECGLATNAACENCAGESYLNREDI